MQHEDIGDVGNAVQQMREMGAISVGGRFIFRLENCQVK